jgi:hypothetical protein
LDLKPYLNYSDSRHSEKQGWLEELPCQEKIIFKWSAEAEAQLNYLAEIWNCHLREAIEQRLSVSPIPYPNNRVKKLGENEYELAYKTWRISYTFKEGDACFKSIKSGYDQPTLSGEKESKWGDVLVHKAFTVHFK